MLVLVLTGLWAYSNSSEGIFLYDDQRLLTGWESGESLWMLWQPTSRPLTMLSFALNRALGGTQPWSYHVVNLVIHLLAALTLFGLIRRTFLTATLRERYATVASPLALIIALLWLLHPLQTQSVTYIIQRGESLMGLWYLLTLYCVVRGAQSACPSRWYLLAIGACALGMSSKPVMVTAPLMALLYDRAFLAGSYREVFRARGWLYGGLAATWVLLAIWLIRGQADYVGTAGLGVQQITPWAYLRTQSEVILHYLRLVLWPHPLVFDYAWPVAEIGWRMAWSSVLIGGLLLLVFWMWRRRPALGFLGLWWFVILAPTSSFIPLHDVAFEHRLYLPIVSIIVLVVIGGYQLLRLLPWRAWRQALAVGLVTMSALILGTITIRRNTQYQSAIKIWGDTVVKRPENVRARGSFGLALVRANRLEEAVVQFQEELRLQADPAIAHDHLAMVRVRQGRFDQAIAHYHEALRLSPVWAQAHYNLGVLLAEQGKFEEAEAQYRQAIRFNPGFAEAHFGLGALRAQQGDAEAAIRSYQDALRLKPNYWQAHYNLGNALLRRGELHLAEEHFDRARQLNSALTLAKQ